MDLLIVGSVALDTVETPHGRVDDAVGGSATYGAYAAAPFAKPGIVGVAGDDFPRAELKAWRRRGVDTEGLELVKGGKTFRWGGKYSADMNSRETLFTHLNVFADFQPVLPPSYRRVRNLFLANIQPELQLQVLDQVRGPRVVVCDTMDLWIETSLPALKRLLKRIDVLLLNDEEALMLSGESSIPAAARALRRMGIERVIIKKGEHGAMMIGPEGPFMMPALPLEVVRDPTGAGDSFAGGLMGWLARRALTPGNWRKAMVVGTAMASFCVEDFGTKRLRRVRGDALSRRIDQLQQMMKVGRI